ncbi:hypothetical protein PSHT_10430, partial [Puccinia striiformis]
PVAAASATPTSPLNLPPNTPASTASTTLAHSSTMNVNKSTTLLCMFGISAFVMSKACGGRPRACLQRWRNCPKSNLYIPLDDPDCKLRNRRIRWCCPRYVLKPDMDYLVSVARSAGGCVKR